MPAEKILQKPLKVQQRKEALSKKTKDEQPIFIFPTPETTHLQKEEAAQLIASGHAKKIIDLAKSYQLQPSEKIQRARYILEKDPASGKTKITFTQPSRIIRQSGKIEPDNIPNLPNSVVNYDGHYYILLRGSLFYNNLDKDNERGIRRGKLAINEAGELVFIKIFEHHNKQDTHDYFMRTEAKPEAAFVHKHAQGPEKKVMTRTKIDTPEKTKTYVALPYKGVNSREFICDDKHPPTTIQLIDLAVQYMQRIIEMNEAGYVHRDLKPDNYAVEISKDGKLQASVIDFGTAREFTAIDSQTQQPIYHDTWMCGTAGFYSPAQQTHLANGIAGDARTGDHCCFNLFTDLFAGAISAQQALSSVKNTQQLTAEQKALFLKIDQYTKDLIALGKPQTTQTHHFSSVRRDREGYPILDREQIKRQLNTFQAELAATLAPHKAPAIPTPRERQPLTVRVARPKRPAPPIPEAIPAPIPAPVKKTTAKATKKSDTTSTFTEKNPLKKSSSLEKTKVAIETMITAYELHFQTTPHPLAVFGRLNPERSVKNQERTKKLRDTIISAKNIEEIQQAFRTCFASYDTNKGIGKNSLIRFVLEDNTVCDALKIPLTYRLSVEKTARVNAKAHILKPKTVVLDQPRTPQEVHL